jgi:hypothetical protein
VARAYEIDILLHVKGSHCVCTAGRGVMNLPFVLGSREAFCSVYRAGNVPSLFVVTVRSFASFRT